MLSRKSIAHQVRCLYHDNVPSTQVISSSKTTGKSALINRMRGSFSQPNPSVSGFIQPVTNDQNSFMQDSLPVQPVIAPALVADQAVVIPSAESQFLSTPEQLDVLDQVLTNVEQIKTQTAEQPVAPPAHKLEVIQPTIPIPVVSQSAVPAVHLADQIDQTNLQNSQQPVISTQDSSIDSGLIAQSLPMAVEQQAEDSLNPPQARTVSAKEAVERGRQGQIVETGKGLQVVEVEPTPEIGPEVEAYLKRAEDSQAPAQQVIVAEKIEDIPDTTNYPKKPVIILPITPDIEKKARFKGPKFSIKWLVEWSKKIMKMFVGKVIYRQVDAD